MQPQPLSTTKKRIRKKEGLPPRYKLFCWHYLSTFNGTLSAKRVFYSVKCAKQKSVDLLRKPEIQRFLRDRIKKMIDQAEFDATYRLKKLKEGVDLSIPTIYPYDSKSLREQKMRYLDVKAGVACIAEANKMQGSYAALSIKVSRLEDVKAEAEKIAAENSEIGNLEVEMKDF